MNSNDHNILKDLLCMKLKKMDIENLIIVAL